MMEVEKGLMLLALSNYNWLIYIPFSSYIASHRILFERYTAQTHIFSHKSISVVVRERRMVGR